MCLPRMKCRTFAGVMGALMLLLRNDVSFELVFQNYMVATAGPRYAQPHQTIEYTGELIDVFGHFLFFFRNAVHLVFIK